MANAKSYGGSFAEGFINAYLQAKKYRTLDAYYKFRMAQAGYTPPAWNDPFGQGRWDAPKTYWDPVKKEWGSPPDPNAGTQKVFQAGYDAANPSLGGASNDDPSIRAHMKEQNTKLVADQLTSRGVPPTIAAGAIAGIMGESGTKLDPSSFNPQDPGGGSGGMGQWNRERLIGGNGMLAFAAQNGVQGINTNNPQDALKVPAAIQAAYIGHELDTSYSHVLAKLRNATSPQEALNIWVNDYEVPLNKARAIAQRTQYIAPVSHMLSQQQQQPTQGVIPPKKSAQAFEPYQVASLGMVPPPTQEPKAAAPIPATSGETEDPSIQAHTKQAGIPTQPSPVGSLPAQPLPPSSTPTTPLPPRYGDYGYTRDAGGNLVPKPAPPTPVTPKVIPASPAAVTPTAPQHTEELKATTGHYTPTTGNVRGPPTWVPDNPPINPIQIHPKNQPKQADASPPVPAPTQAAQPQPTPAPASVAQPAAQPAKSAPDPVIPTPGATRIAQGGQDNMDDMMAMRELTSDSNAGGPIMKFATGGPVPGQIVHFAGQDPLMSGLAQSALGSTNNSGSSAGLSTAGSSTPNNASAGSVMGSALGMSAYPQASYLMGASLGANNTPMPLTSTPSSPQAQATAAGYADGGDVEEPQTPTTSQPNVTSDQSVNDVSSQVAQGTALMGQAAKQEGAMGPQVHEDHTRHNLAAMGNKAPATPGQGVVQQGGLATQLNQMRYQIQNWPSIFSFGAQGNPNVGSQTGSTGFADGGSVAQSSGSEDDLQPPEMTDYQMAYAGGQDPTPQIATPSEGIIPPQQVAMLGGMPHMGSSINLPSPRMGLGTGSTPRVSAPKGKPGTGDVTGGMPENLPHELDSHPDHSLPVGEDANKIPNGTPQIADRSGNPSKGFTDALQGGLKAIMGIFGLGGQQGAMQDPSQQPRHEDFQRPDGEITPSHEEMQKVYQAVDPHQQLNIAQRNIAGMEAVHQYYLLQGQPELADKMVASMVMYSRDVAAKYGDIALQALHHGDLDKAVEAERQGYDWVPDGRQVAVTKVGDSKYNIQQRNLNNKALWEQEVGPQEIMAGALGLKSGVQFWRELEKTASQWDRTSAANVKARDDYQARQVAEADDQRKRDIAAGYAQKVWQPPTDDGGTATASAPAPAATPGVIPTQAQATTAAPPPAAPAPAPAPSTEDPSINAHANNMGIKPGPAPTAPQPGPPPAQPTPIPAKPSVADVPTADASPVEFKEPTQQIAEKTAQIQQQYAAKIAKARASLTMTGDKTTDAESMRSYSSWLADQEKQRAADIASMRAEESANARVAYQGRAQQHSDDAAQRGREFTAERDDKREQARREDDAKKEHDKALAASRTPLHPTDTANIMERADQNAIAQTLGSIKDVQPSEVRFLHGMVGHILGFNGHMAPEDIADFIRGFTTPLKDGKFEYGVMEDKNSRVEPINDENGERATFPIMTSNGMRFSITLTKDDFASLKKMRDDRTPKEKPPAVDTSMYAPPPIPSAKGMSIHQSGSPSPMPWAFSPTPTGHTVNPRHAAPTQGVIPPKSFTDYLPNIPRPNIHPYSEQ